jgi:stage II sporulation protein R
MKKIILIIVCIIGLILLINEQQSDELRIRVIANSDSTSDQLIKQKIVRLIKNKIATFNKDEFKEIKYTIEIKETTFPTKEVEGRIIPGGVYSTLLVVIGSGVGKNWWSLLYPDYHNISFEDLETGEVEFKFYFFK